MVTIDKTSIFYLVHSVLQLCCDTRGLALSDGLGGLCNQPFGVAKMYLQKVQLGVLGLRGTICLGSKLSFLRENSKNRRVAIQKNQDLELKICTE